MIEWTKAQKKKSLLRPDNQNKSPIICYQAPLWNLFKLYQPSLTLWLSGEVLKESFVSLHDHTWCYKLVANNTWHGIWLGTSIYTLYALSKFLTSTQNAPVWIQGTVLLGRVN